MIIDIRSTITLVCQGTDLDWMNSKAHWYLRANLDPAHVSVYGIDDPCVKVRGAGVGWLWHPYPRLPSSEVRFYHANHHLRRPLPHPPFDLWERFGGRLVYLLVVPPGVGLHDAQTVRVLVGVHQSCKNLGSVVALLQGNFLKIINLRQFLRKNAQSCRDYKVFHSTFCH